MKTSFLLYLGLLALLIPTSTGGAVELTLAPSCVRAPDGIVSWWPLGPVQVGRVKTNVPESGVTFAPDVRGHNPGQLYGGVTPSKDNNYLVFDGKNNSYIAVDPDSSLKPPQFTITAWVKPLEIRYDKWDAVFCAGGSQGHPQSIGDRDSYFLGLRRGNPYFQTYHEDGVNDEIQGNDQLQQNQWYLLSAVFDGHRKALYVNDKLVASTVVNAPIKYDPYLKNITIGNDINNDGFPDIAFNGAIDEVLFFNRPLATKEITSIYGAAPGSLCACNPGTNSEDYKLVGQWSKPFETTIPAVHAHLLPTGKVLYSSMFECGGRYQIWDPSLKMQHSAHQIAAGNRVCDQSDLKTAPYRIFCSGHAFTAEGDLVFTGGHPGKPDDLNHQHDGGSYSGILDSASFNAFSEKFSKLPDLQNHRWYPTTILLPDGRMLVVAGQDQHEAQQPNAQPPKTYTSPDDQDELESVKMVPFPEIIDPESPNKSWKTLTGEKLYLPYYPYLFVAPNGNIFNAGPNEKTRYLDTSTGKWHPPVADSVLTTNYGARNWGSAVMYDEGKVMIVGGSHCGPYVGIECTEAPTRSVEVIDLESPMPKWYTAASMNYPRKQLNATLLPDGKVLVTGGTASSYSFENKYGCVLPAELWDPNAGPTIPGTNLKEGRWIVLAEAPGYRGYHSTAILLPDGRVLTGGGNEGGSSMEFFSPPYLFDKYNMPAKRPIIVSVSKEKITYGQELSIKTLAPKAIGKVTLIRLSSVTHSFNAGQRINFLVPHIAGSEILVNIPKSANLCTPGYYMLFLIDKLGVPSKAHMIKIQRS